MALMIGAGALGHAPAGRFNVELPRERLLLWEPYRRRMRAKLGDELVLDSRHGMLYEFGQLPRCYFPREDLRMDLLEPNGQTKQSPLTGETVYWRLRADGHLVERAALSHSETPDDAPDLDGYVSLFCERARRVVRGGQARFRHVRDPYHRVDALPTSLPGAGAARGRACRRDRAGEGDLRDRTTARWYIPARHVTPSSCSRASSKPLRL